MVTLKEIDRSNLPDCLRLELGAGQEKFVSPPVRSLAWAYVYRDQCRPFGVFDAERMVGYLLLLYDDGEKTYNLLHMMIDRTQQGRGFGREALRLVIEAARKRPFGPSDTLLLTCDPANAAARSLYRSIGFEPTGRADGGEEELALRLV